MAHIYTEITDDKGYARKAIARDNNAEYVLTSALRRGRYDNLPYHTNQARACLRTARTDRIRVCSH